MRTDPWKLADVLERTNVAGISETQGLNPNPGMAPKGPRSRDFILAYVVVTTINPTNLGEVLC